MPNIKGSHVNFCNTVVKSPQQSQNFHLFQLNWLIYVKILVLFPSILLIIQFTFSFNQRLFMHIIQSTGTKKTFCWCYTKYTRKLLSVSLKASVKCCSKPLKDRCFDFTDEFKHSELSDFTLQMKKQIIFFGETVFISTLNLKMEVSRPGNQVCFNLAPRVSHLWGGKMRDAGNEVGYVFPVSQR